MKKFLAALLFLVFVVPAVYGMGAAPEGPSAAYPYLIDNFEDGTYTKDPEWFTFDNLVLNISRNSRLQEGDSSVLANLGEYSLYLSGSATDWYVGGMGCVLGIDASGYATFDADVYGTGDGSGVLKIELYDDDNGNSDIEVDKNWKPLYDDKWEYRVNVDWSGWKHLSIPFSEFTNAGRGNGSFDPNLQGGSGGLVKIQLICVANSQTGSINYNIDNLELGTGK